LKFLTCRRGIRKLARLRRSSLLKLPAIGPAFAARIQAWQQDPCFGPDARLALYLGMATLDNRSGKFRGSKAPKHQSTKARQRPR